LASVDHLTVKNSAFHYDVLNDGLFSHNFSSGCSFNNGRCSFNSGGRCDGVGNSFDSCLFLSKNVNAGQSDKAKG